MKGLFDRLFVLWADPEGRRYPIGELWRSEEGFRFAYRREWVAKAQEVGFHLLAEFPELRETPYEANSLFASFRKRIPLMTRPDTASILESLGVSSDDPMEILAKSGGVLLTDRLELAEYREPADGLDRPLTFRLSGRRFTDQVTALHPGQELKLERDRDNPRDPSATILLTLGGARIGWVPRQYSELVSRLLDFGIELRACTVRQLLLPENRGRWVVRIERDRSDLRGLRVAEP